MDLDKTADRIVHLEEELGRAWRALVAYANASETTNARPSDAQRAYHSLALGAAKRFVHEGAFDGTAYFIGKPVEILHEALQK